MDETYDAIILGTGITECILSGILSVEGKKVLHMDRNSYYGGECASLNLTQLYEKFRPGQTAPSHLGRDRDYAIDLIPKFMMANGELVDILVHTDVTRYLDFKLVAGSYVMKNGRISKVPATQAEAVTSSLMGFLEKRRMKQFLEFTSSYDEGNPSTQQGVNLDRTLQSEVFYKFGLDRGTQDFIGHALALHIDDTYLSRPARDTHERILLYTRSLAKYGKSPYLYPNYGLGELPQAFARLSAIYGGTYMLDRPGAEVQYDEASGRACGVTAGGETAKATMVIGDPSYFPNKVRKTGSVIRAICLLRHPIPNTDDSDSIQIVLPQNQIGRRNDIYIAMVSGTHSVCGKDYYVAFVSTTVETATPEAEIQVALQLLGPIEEKFVSITDLHEPIAAGDKDGVYITRSLDATSHFETVVRDVKDVYARIMGKPLALQKREGLPEN